MTNKDMAILLDGDALAQRLRSRLSERVAGLAARGVVPTMATVRVGNDPASRSYVARKHADCVEIGVKSQAIELPAEVKPDRLEAEIDRLNADPNVHGFLVQLPLPGGLDEAHFISRVSPAKDMDGLHPTNLGLLLAGTPGILACTPAGILALLRHHDVPLAGRNVVIIGRGTLVGRPLAMLLSMRGTDATVTLAHAGTTDIPTITRSADIVISAVGRPGLVTADMVRPGAAVVGVGISYDDDGKMISDIAADVDRVAGWLTPPHGSVGALTRAMLLTNLVDMAENAN